MIMNEIQYRKLNKIEEMHEASTLIHRIWGDEAVISPFLFIAQSYVGGCLIGAFHNEQLIGVNYGFIGKQEKELFLYSHLLAVDQAYQGKKIGEYLKREQLEVAKKEGLTKIVWTFDPLQSKNAYLNFHKLGTVSDQYKQDYYGTMENHLNKGTDSDRLIVEWYVTPRDVEEREHTLIDCVIEMKEEMPVIRSWSPIYASVVSIPIPTDIQMIKDKIPEEVIRWQLFIREAMNHYLNDGYKITNFDYKRNRPIQYYVLVIPTSLS